MYGNVSLRLHSNVTTTLPGIYVVGYIHQPRIRHVLFYDEQYANTGLLVCMHTGLLWVVHTLRCRVHTHGARNVFTQRIHTLRIRT